MKQQLTDICNQMASAEYYPTTVPSVNKELQLWKEYDSSGHSPVENMSFAKSTISALNNYLQSDINQAKRDIDALRSARRKKRHGFKKLLSIAAVMTVFCAPVGLATLGSAVASHHGGGGDISSLEAMIRKNQAFISKLNSVMKLLFRVCCYLLIIGIV